MQPPSITLTTWNAQAAGRSAAAAVTVMFNCLLEFDTDDVQFCRGFEAGRLWEMAKEGPFDQVISTQNVEMAMRIAEACEVSFRAEELDDDWMQIWFE